MKERMTSSLRTTLRATVTAVTFASSAALAGAPSPAPAPASAAPAAPVAPAAHVEVALPTEAGAGPAKEVKPLLDNAHLKLATIILRKGTLLPEHSSPMPVTIMALKGSGTASVAGKKIRLDAGHMVFVAPSVPHSVEPDAGTDLVLLVHHVKIAGAKEGGPHAHGAKP